MKKLLIITVCIVFGLSLVNSVYAAVNTIPTASINNPKDGGTYDEGNYIVFNGSGDDTEDGTLPGSSLVWNSSKYGMIFTGTSFTTDILPTGTHIITLTATDSNGSAGSVSITITVGNTSPTATITNPSDGSTYDEGNYIIFNGSGNDSEDGPLSGGSLVWNSSKDGTIGTGNSFTTNTLSAGTHIITLTATDSDGAAGSASITVTVSATTTPVSQCATFDSSTNTLNIPCLDLGGPTKYWLDLMLTNDQPLTFELGDFGSN